MVWFASRPMVFAIAPLCPLLLWGTGVAIAPAPVWAQADAPATQDNSVPGNWPVLVNQAIVQKDFQRALSLFCHSP